MVKTKQHMFLRKTILFRSLDDLNSLTLFEKLTTISQSQNKYIKVSGSLPQTLLRLSSTSLNQCCCNCVTIDLKIINRIHDVRLPKVI